MYGVSVVIIIIIVSIIIYNTYIIYCSSVNCVVKPLCSRARVTRHRCSISHACIYGGGVLRGCMWLAKIEGYVHMGNRVNQGTLCTAVLFIDVGNGQEIPATFVAPFHISTTVTVLASGEKALKVGSEVVTMHQ